MNDGTRAFGVPRVQLNLYGEYDTPFAPGLTLPGRVIYASRATVDAAATQSVPGWTVFDVGARYAFTVRETRLTARFAVENLFDNGDWISRSGVGAGGFLSLGAPRTDLFSLSADL